MQAVNLAVNLLAVFNLNTVSILVLLLRFYLQQQKPNFFLPLDLIFLKEIKHQISSDQSYIFVPLLSASSSSVMSPSCRFPRTKARKERMSASRMPMIAKM